MLKSLSIENFRCFEKFGLSPLGRINLLVGQNNSGKTSILEAVHILCSGGNLEPLKNVMLRREDVNNDTENVELEASHLFHGYKLYDEFSIHLSGINHNNQTQNLQIKFYSQNYVPETLTAEQKEEIQNAFRNAIPKLEEADENHDPLSIQFIKYFFDESNAEVWVKIFSDFIQSSPQLLIQGNYNNHGREDPIQSDKFSYRIQSSQHGKIKFKDLPSRDQDKSQNIKLISLPALQKIDMLNDFENIILTPEEEIVQKTLQIIEPNLDKVAVSQGKFFARFSDSSQRIPLGNLGEGMRYLLGLTLALVKVPNGVLLVDDIDTGLHYSALTDMWKLVWETAKNLNVQVFATTHNSDCWQSLADIAEQNDVDAEDITIHRIEKGASRSVFYTAPKIVVAADRELEVR